MTNVKSSIRLITFRSLCLSPLLPESNKGDAARHLFFDSTCDLSYKLSVIFLMMILCYVLSRPMLKTYVRISQRDLISGFCPSPKLKEAFKMPTNLLWKEEGFQSPWNCFKAMNRSRVTVSLQTKDPSLALTQTDTILLIAQWTFPLNNHAQSSGCQTERARILNFFYSHPTIA